MVAVDPPAKSLSLFGDLVENTFIPQKVKRQESTGPSAAATRQLTLHEDSARGRLRAEDVVHGAVVVAEALAAEAGDLRGEIRARAEVHVDTLQPDESHFFLVAR